MSVWTGDSPRIRREEAMRALREDGRLEPTARALARRRQRELNEAANITRMTEGAYWPSSQVAKIVAQARFRMATSAAELAPLEAELDVRVLLRAEVNERAAYDPLMAVFAERCAALRSHGDAEVRQMGEDCGAWLAAYERGSDWPTTTYP